jgi:hypothetical protein
MVVGEEADDKGEQKHILIHTFPSRDLPEGLLGPRVKLEITFHSYVVWSPSVGCTSCNINKVTLMVYKTPGDSTSKTSYLKEFRMIIV